MRTIALCAALLTSACAPVRPWERSALTERCMSAAPDPLEASFAAHLHATRESAQGATGVGAAACGCN